MEKNERSIKIIHYCWFGPRQLSKLAKKCMATWKKFLPDYEIKLWNENNFDFNQNPFVKQAYENKKWAFVSDYARLKALSEYGGIYLDTDMEIIKDISDVLNDECFLGVEDSGLINAAVIGSKKPHNKFIDTLISNYNNLKEFDEKNIYAMTIPRQITNILEPLGFDKNKQEIQQFFDGELKVYPREYFYPLSYDYQDNKFTDKSCMVHKYDATWASKPEKAKLFFRRHNLKFMMKSVDICVSVKIRIKRIINRMRGKKNEEEY